MYEVRLDQRAARDMDRLRGELWQRIRDTLLSLEQNPRPQGSQKLRGTEDTYRIRVGEYRIIYEVDDKRRSVTIRRVKHRGDAYRGL